jgi:hypothetical protein
MAQYTFVDHWYIQAPMEEVFHHIADARTYPQWWPVYPKVEVLRDVSPEMVGSRARLFVKSALGYTLTLEVEIVEADPPRYLKTAATGQLEGTGLWELEMQGDMTHAIFTWIVASHHPLLNLLEPVAKPLFAWSHNDASRKGHLGLKRRLEKTAQGATG